MSLEITVTPTTQTSLQNQVKTLTRILEEMGNKKELLINQIEEAAQKLQFLTKLDGELSTRHRSLAEQHLVRVKELNERSQTLDARESSLTDGIKVLDDKHQIVLQSINSNIASIQQLQEEQKSLTVLKQAIDDARMELGKAKEGFEAYKQIFLSEFAEKERGLLDRTKAVMDKERACQDHENANIIESQRLRNQSEILASSVASAQITLDCAAQSETDFSERSRKLSEREALVSQREEAQNKKSVFLMAKEKDLIGYKQQLLMEEARITELADRSSIPTHKVVL